MRQFYTAAVTIKPSGRARVAFAVAASEASDHARALVAGAGSLTAPGERIRAARLLRVADLTVLDRAVICERLDGASWEQIAEALALPLDETIRRHAEACEVWATAEPQPGPGEWTVGTVDDAQLESTAAAVDAWHRRHAEPWENAPDAPVTRAL